MVLDTENYIKVSELLPLDHSVDKRNVSLDIKLQFPKLDRLKQSAEIYEEYKRKRYSYLLEKWNTQEFYSNGNFCLIDSKQIPYPEEVIELRWKHKNLQKPQTKPKSKYEYRNQCITASSHKKLRKEKFGFESVLSDSDIGVSGINVEKELNWDGNQDKLKEALSGTKCGICHHRLIKGEDIVWASYEGEYCHKLCYHRRKVLRGQYKKWYFGGDKR